MKQPIRLPAMINNWKEITPATSISAGFFIGLSEDWVIVRVANAR